MITYNLMNAGTDSLYEYLCKCIKKDIIRGTLKPGEKLPSKRIFASNLGVSVITVENAYAQLVAEGYIYSVPKKGFYIADVGMLKTKDHAMVPEKAASLPVRTRRRCWKKRKEKSKLIWRWPSGKAEAVA